MQIIADKQASAQLAGRLPLSTAEQCATLESATNLPPGLIPEAVSPPPAVTRSARRPWQHDFPFPIKDVVAAAARQRAAATAPRTSGRATPPRLGR